MSFLTKKKKLIFLFLSGFLIGICLEIVLIEKEKIKRILIQDSLNETAKITCMVLIKHQHMRYVTSSKKTWLKHCSNYSVINVQRLKSVGKLRAKILTSSFSAEKFHGIIKNYTVCAENEDIKDISAENAWAGLCKAIHFVKQNHFHWLVIVPDNLVVLIENLKLFVKNLNCDKGYYFGYTLKNSQADYNVLSAGILLSRGAIRKLLQIFYTEDDCDFGGKYWKNEDFFLGKYLKQLNILPKDTRDNYGRGRFHGYNMNNLLWPGKLFMQSDYKKKALYPVSQGFNCCSPFMITVDVSDPDSMNNLYFFLYKINASHKKPPKKAEVNKTEESYWKKFLREEGYNETEIEKMTNEEYYKIWEQKLPQSKMYQEMQNIKNNIFSSRKKNSNY